MRRVFIPPLLQAPPPMPAAARALKLDGASMGTSWSVQLYAPPELGEQDLCSGIQQQLDQVVAQMSHWESASALCQFNRSAGWHSLPPEFFQVLDYAVYLARQTGGAYDPAAGQLVDLWGFGPAGRRQRAPSEAEIRAARPAVGWRQLQLDRQQRRAWQPGGLQLNLSSIAKGYAVDQVARWLETRQISSYLVEVGGELRGAGLKPDHSPWWVALEAPDDATPDLVALHRLAVATSGDYRQHFEQDGRRYSHTLDPRSGYPITHGLAAVSVLHPTCMVADALATALGVLGLEQGLAYAGQQQIAARFVQRTAHGLQHSLSPALAAMLE